MSTAKKFVLLFPVINNTLLNKDVGALPLGFNKYLGYDYEIVAIRNKSNLNDIDIKYRDKIKLLPRIFEFKDIELSYFWYLLFNSRKIDLLNLYHFDFKSAIYAIVYKFINSKGKILLKTDINPNQLKEDNYNIINPKAKSFYILKKLFYKSDYISFETNDSLNGMKNKYSEFSNKFKHLPNGVFWENKIKPNWRDKENIIISVARFGTFQKNTELLLGALSKVEFTDWKVYLIGPIEKSFISYIDKFYENNVSLKDKIFFLNELEKEKLDAIYLKSKLFILSSRYEGFSLAMIEALSFGCSIITTNLISTKELINNKNGIFIVPQEDEKSFTHEINSFIKLNESKIENFFNENINYSIENHDWAINIKNILIKS